MQLYCDLSFHDPGKPPEFVCKSVVEDSLRCLQWIVTEAVTQRHLKVEMYYEDGGVPLEQAFNSIKEQQRGSMAPAHLWIVFLSLLGHREVHLEIPLSFVDWIKWHLIRLVGGNLDGPFPVYGEFDVIIENSNSIVAVQVLQESTYAPYEVPEIALAFANRSAADYNWKVPESRVPKKRLERFIKTREDF